MMRLLLPERIETKRLILQRLRYEDAEEIFYTYASKPEATKYVSWPTHERISDTRNYLKYAIHGWNLGIDYSFAIRLKETNLMIGSFGVLNEHGKLQFGYILSPTQWGMGYATEVCKVMMPILRSRQGVFRVGTFVDVENLASAKVLQKSGLIEEVRLPNWHRFVNQNSEARNCILFRLP
ncbi:MAG: GNAT family N-acetyltransferase [Bacteroidia bacterium]|nr:GNAT family N-acetyltransferase [Bacteroidia bacterium]